MSAITYKCPNCGGELKFDPGKQQYHCEYCISDFDQETLDQLQPERGTEEKAEDQEGAVVYSCPSCGAQIITDETTAASFCYYCHNPVVLSGRLEGEYLPDAILPFSMGYLSGFQAEKRDMEKDSFSESLQEDCRRYTREMLLDTVQGYASVNPRNTEIRVDKSDWSYLLLPVWVLTYRGKDNRLYYYAMNGQNGKTAGDLPTDQPKAAAFSAVLGVIVLILCLIGGYLI